MNRDVNENQSNPRPVRRRRKNEQPIKDFIVIIGSLMMFMCFGLILETSIREWHSPPEKKRAVVAILALITFASLFIVYSYTRLRNQFLQNSQQSLASDEVSTTHD